VVERDLRWASALHAEFVGLPHCHHKSGFCRLCCVWWGLSESLKLPQQQYMLALALMGVRQLLN